MQARISSVVVLGGGPAGWMTAAYLRKALQGTVSVTVLEEPETAGDAGIEAAPPTLQRSFFSTLGIAEDDWMRESEATFGTAVRFLNWRTPGPGDPAPRALPEGGTDAFYHPYGLLPEYDEIPLSHYWYHRRHHGGPTEPFDRACFREPPLLDARRSPRWMDGRPATRYGWHLDRASFTDFLRRHATLRLGAHRVPGTLARVELDANGFLETLHTTAGEALSGDLFVDCSGPRSRLLRQVMAEPYLDLGDQLLCDRAVTVRLPHDDYAHGIEPYSTVVAMPAGWAGKVPVLGRFESSYVYASAFVDAGSATEQLCRLWGVDPAQAEVGETAFRAGRTRRAWVRNCVGIGASAGLLEPLEPTALHFVASALRQLVRHFPADAFHPAVLDGFNREVAAEFDESRDFVQAHFACSRRTDTPFWRAHRDVVLPDSLRAKTVAYRAGLPLGAPQPEQWPHHGGAAEPGRLWSAASYCAVLAGLGLEPDAPLPVLAHRPDSVRGAEPLFERIKRQQQNLVETLPDAHDYLRHLHGRSVADHPQSVLRPGG
ncbi:tryptophan halogenase family protein [Kitasatospora sp. NPDC094028]